MHIGIKEPCSENWNGMSPTEKGAFCGKCQKEVVDFSNWSTKEIRTELATRINDSVCGRMGQDQLLQLNHEFDEFQFRSKRSFQVAFLFSLLVVFGLTLFSCENEQEKQKVSQLQEVVKIDDEQKDPIKELEDLTNEAESDLRMGKVERQIESREMMLGEMVMEVEDIVEVQKFDERHMVAGGIGYSVEYNNHLDLLNDVQKDVTVTNALIPTSFEIEAWPNPTIDNAKIKISVVTDQITQVYLYDLTGKKIRTISEGNLRVGYHEFDVELIDQPPGTYIIVVNSPNLKESVKIIKQ